MVKEGGGAVILRLTSAQYFSGIPTALSSASFLCLISSNLRRLQHTPQYVHLGIGCLSCMYSKAWQKMKVFV